ncbi:MAG: MBL fold metallo-hydrolase [Chitinophagales bacterium]|nr:MBL fold metallo-hydrolase [Chitinophagales bacterium]MDW8428849.1 MBL fold metallo-hydrolase [Chitinophagales bacterium]
MVFPLYEGTFTVDQTKKFLPFDPHNDNLQERSQGSLLVDVVPFLIVTDDGLAVVDPGLGTGNQQPWIHVAIQKCGFSPLDVRYVLLSHFHKDHAGGATWFDGKQWQLTFPRAVVYVQEKEVVYASEKKHSPSYRWDALEFLFNHPQLTRLKGAARINSQIHVEACNGHTPGHQCFHFFLAHGHYFFGGDVAPHAHQLLRRFLAKYDAHPVCSKTLRQQWAQQGAAEGWQFLFFHDAQRAVAEFAWVGSGIRLKAHRIATGFTASSST